MLFNSVHFLIFLPVVVLIYYIIPDKMKQIWLLIASYYFYMCWNPKYILLIVFSTLITYIGGLLIQKIKQRKWTNRREVISKKLVVSLNVILNLGILFYYKYANFAFETIEKAFHSIHIELRFSTFDVLLPVGISFYTFQALSYTLDVYRDKICAEKNFIRYALFVSFFPQLVAGPIERSENLLKQLAKAHKFNFEMARDGFLLMLWGFFLKIVLADRIALFVDTVYLNYYTFSGGYLIIATILFAIQIYCDFYGYSVIAMGVAEILGITLMENFDCPYLSMSVSEFWRRWHISLTSWFKDYLYIPIGGSRKGKIRKYINKIIVFLISGLWHGAQFSYVAWGGLNGLYQIIGEILQPIRDRAVMILRLNRKSLGHRLLQGIITFILIDFSWIFFRARRFKEAFEIIKQMVKVKNPWILFDGSLYKCGLDRQNFWLMLICICILFFADLCKKKEIRIRAVIAEQDYWFRWVFIALAVWAIVTFGIWGPGYKEANFIYFQF